MTDVQKDGLAEKFVRQAVASPELRSLFRSYFKHVYRTKWSARGSFKKDPLVIKFCESGHSVDGVLKSVRREVDDAYKGKLTTKKLKQYADLLGRTVDDLIADVYVFAAESGGFKTIPGKLIIGSTGHYILEKGMCLTDDQGIDYQVVDERKISDQMRGDSYVGRELNSGEEVFIKTLSLSKDLDIKDIQRRLKYFDRYYEQERESLEKLGEHDVLKVAQLRGCGRVKLDPSEGLGKDALRRPILVPFLVQDYIKGKNLYEKMKDAFYAEKVRSDPVLYLTIARQCLMALRDIHHYGIRHGDVRPDNFMVSDDESGNPILSLVDFGQSAFAGSIPNRQVSGGPEGFLIPLAPERVHSDSNAPLEIAEDLFMVGNVLYWLASGRFFEHDDDGTKSEDLQTEVRDNIRPLFEHNEGILFAICQCLHHKPENRASTASEVLSTLDLFESLSSTSSPPASTASTSLSIDLKPLTKTIRDISKFSEVNPFFVDTMKRDIDRITRRFHEIGDLGYVEVTGSRDEIITSLLNYMSLLKKEDQYFTTTTIDYWRPSNLGISGRFLAANKILAQHEVHLRRVFIVSEDEINREDGQEIARRVLQSQAKVVEEFREGRIVQTTNKNVFGEGYYVGVHQVKTDQEKNNLLRNGRYVGLIRRKDGKPISLSFHPDRSSSRDGVIIRKLVVSEVSHRQDNEIMSLMQENLSQSVDIEQFCKSLPKPK